jgi:hypothetical protein
MKYLYDENQSFNNTRAFSEESDDEVRYHIDRVYKETAAQRAARQEQIVTTVRFLGIGCLLIGAVIVYFISRPTGRPWTLPELFSHLLPNGLLFLIPGLLGLALGMKGLLKSFPDYLEETIHDRYNALQRKTSPSTAQITRIEPLSPRTRQISFVYQDGGSKMGYGSSNFTREGIFITASPTDLQIGDEVPVVAKDEIAVLL